MEVRSQSMISVLITHYSQGLLDFSREFDVGLMDKVVQAFYQGPGPDVCQVLRGGAMSSPRYSF